MNKFAARDAQIVAAYEAAVSCGHVDYNKIGADLTSPISYKQVKRVLQENGITPVAVRPGRPPASRSPLNAILANVGELVRLHRIHNELDATQLSDLTEIPVRVIGNIEAGVHNLTLMEMLTLCKVLKVPITDFTGKDEYD